MAQALDGKNIVFLRNHGVSFFADGAPKLALSGVFLERAARSFLRARSAGLRLLMTDPDDTPLMLVSMTSEGFLTDNWAYLLRLLDRREGA